MVGFLAMLRADSDLAAVHPVLANLDTEETLDRDVKATAHAERSATSTCLPGHYEPAHSLPRRIYLPWLNKPHPQCDGVRSARMRLTTRNQP